MKIKIPNGAFRIAFDDVYFRFFLLSARSVHILDQNANDELKTLEIDNPNQIFLSKKNDIIAVKSTTGGFFFYSAKELSFLGKIQMRGKPNTDSDFYYEETENVLYGIANKGLKQYCYRISLHSLAYSLFSMPQFRREIQKDDKTATRYIFYKYFQGSFYLIRDIYDIGKSSPLIYESSYGRYNIEANTLILKDVYFSTNEYHLKLLDVTEQKSYRRFVEFCKNHRIDTSFIKSHRNGYDLFFITHKAVYREDAEGSFKEIYHDEYIWDYAEFQCRRYICTWNGCIVQRI